MVDIYAVGASFLGTGVELVEALTIVLAVGAVGGWKSSLLGAFSAAALLGVLVAIIGAPLVSIVNVSWVQLVVGLFMLLFGIRWLRKAILRYAGLKARHDEAASYEAELERQRKMKGSRASGVDHFAFTTSFSGTFLEGLEATFIVITFGLGSGAMSSSILGAVLAAAVVLAAGALLRRPLTRVPENTLKFIVGVMLTSFGAFWVGEGIGVSWPQGDLSVAYLAASLLVLSWLQTVRCRRALRSKASAGSTAEVRS